MSRSMEPTDTPPPPAPYRPEYAEEAHDLFLLGDMDEEAIAKALEVSLETLQEWRATVPEFAEAVRKAGKLADGRAARGLHRRTTGCSHPAVKIFLPSGTTEPVHAKYDRHLPPHPTAALKWLEARHPQVWRDKGETKAPETNDIEKLKERLKHLSSDELWSIAARELHKLDYRPPGDQA